MTIHTLQDLCYAYNVADPVREKLFALQDRIDALEKKLAERSAEHLAAHITYDRGYQAGRQDAEDAKYDEDEVLAETARYRAEVERLNAKLAEPMTEVADRFAHRMALELACVLSDGAYSNKWYTSAMQVLSEYRSAMNAIHEQHSPTFMGEPRV